MAAVKPIVAILFGAIINACAATSSEKHCGVAFCISLAKISFVSSEKGEDFNVYHFRRGASNFAIYEGNYPRRLGGNAFELSRISGGKLEKFRRHEQSQLLFERTKRDWPIYVSVESNCTGGACVALEIGNFISLR